ncbi:MAG TPA: hypothetical protein VE225_03190, partial [Rubrobacteraceae bacterium]|nr:hypothetical protein [Rubrobacteraceae bacterium]
MREVKIESLQKVEVTDGEVRILTNSGALSLVFPRALWERAIGDVSSPSEPTPEELEELQTLKRRLKEHAGEHSFATAVEGVPSGGIGSDQRFDLVLRPGGMLAATTGYAFLPVVSPEHMALF